MNQKRPLSEKPQNQAILRYMRQHHSAGLTVGECSDLGLGTELRKRLSELRREGYVFREIVEPNKNAGTHKRWFIEDNFFKMEENSAVCA